MRNEELVAKITELENALLDFISTLAKMNARVEVEYDLTLENEIASVDSEMQMKNFFSLKRNEKTANYDEDEQIIRIRIKRDIIYNDENKIKIEIERE